MYLLIREIITRKILVWKVDHGNCFNCESSYWNHHSFLSFGVCFSPFCFKEQIPLQFLSSSPFSAESWHWVGWYWGQLRPERTSTEPALPNSPWPPFSLFLYLCVCYQIAAVTSAQQSARATSYPHQHLGKISAQYGKVKVFPSLESCFPSLVQAPFIWGAECTLCIVGGLYKVSPYRRMSSPHGWNEVDSWIHETTSAEERIIDCDRTSCNITATLLA